KPGSQPGLDRSAAAAVTGAVPQTPPTPTRGNQVPVADGTGKRAAVPQSSSGTRPGAPSASAASAAGRPPPSPPPRTSGGAPPLPLDPRGETGRLPQQDQVRAAPSGAAAPVPPGAHGAPTHGAPTGPAAPAPGAPTMPSGRKRTPTAPRFPATGG